MNVFTIVFLFALVASFAVEFWLGRRQKSYVSEHRDAVPPAFQEAISLESHQKAADYTLEKIRVGTVSGIIGGILLLVLTIGGGIEWVNGILAGFEMSMIMSGVLLIISVLVIHEIVELPISLYQTFSVEERFGFNRNTPKQFVVDLGLQFLLTLAIGGSMIALILWVMDSTGEAWWLLAWAILMSFTLFMSWAFPTFIAPLFNKFTPLADDELNNKIQTLLARCGFTSKGIFVMDGSRRSGHGNAYFTGLGNHKRIVFFDTLIDALEHDELEAVLAHELGHFKRKHVIKMLIASSAISFLGFAILGWLVDQPQFYSGLGISQSSNAAALLLFVLVSPIFTMFLQPLTAYFQRKHEFEADDFASKFARPSALISALVKLYRDNASTLTPDPLYSAFHYSHPPASIRINNLSSKMKASFS